jgi:glycosyltransferase involved in cell wall biosynthesis
VILITLNSAKTLDQCLRSLQESKFDQLVIVDGGSTDETEAIARKYTTEFYRSERGMGIQHWLSVEKAVHPLILGIEADNFFPPRFVQEFSAEFVSSGFFGMQPSLEVLRPTNFFERGLSRQYEFLFEKKGQKDLIGGPNIYFKESYLGLVKGNFAPGYSIDTQLAELYKNSGLKVGVGLTKAFVYKPTNFRSFYKKQTYYGYGDFDFFNSHKKNWSFQRKVKSLLHPFLRYGVIFPYKSLLAKDLGAAIYFFLSMIFRYSGWIERTGRSFLNKPANIT